VIRILLVDDHASVRQALAIVFERDLDCTVVAQTGSVAETLEAPIGFDVAVIDLDLPNGDAVELIRQLCAANPDGTILALIGGTNQGQIARAVETGAAGVLPKSVRITDIISAIRRLSQGEQLLSPQEIVDLLRRAGQQREQQRDAQLLLARLTPREREVLQDLAEGRHDKEIAQQLHISSETARTHMVNVLRKLGVESRLQALVFAVRHGAVTID